MDIPFLALDEVKNANKFEELIAAYFRELKKANSNIYKVDVSPPGIGVDGGRDILIDFLITDTIREFKRRWVVQCKFHNRNISTKHVSDINVPSLIHSYNASGYLLICKESATTKLTDMFERLNRDCKFNYHYEIWSGELFKSQLHLLPAENIIYKNFFPKYYNSLQKITSISTI